MPKHVLHFLAQSWFYIRFLPLEFLLSAVEAFQELQSLCRSMFLEPSSRVSVPASLWVRRSSAASR